MKLRYSLLLAGILGAGAGYIGAPHILPPLLKAMYGDADSLEAEFQKTLAETAPDEGAGKDGTATTNVSGAKSVEHEGLDLSDEADEGKDRLADHVDADSFDDDAELAEEDVDEDDVTPGSIASYKRKGEDSGKRPVSEPEFHGNLSASVWKNPKLLEKRLAGRIRSRLRGVDQEKVEALLKDPEMRLMLAQWELLHRADLDALSQLMKDRETCKDLSLLLNDLKWVSSFVYDGEMEKPEIALSMIRHLRQVDPHMDDEVLVDGSGDRKATEGGIRQPGLKRRVAAAIAVEFVRNGWYGEEKELTKEELESFKDLGVMLPAIPTAGKRSSSHNKKDPYRAARERYQFFAESIDQDLLNDRFATLPDWLLHFPCGWKGNSAFGTATTMRWLRDNCSVPERHYLGMAFHVPYLPTNVYGDSIHSEWYYQPFNVLYPGNFAKETRDVGAVCGGLSHFGTSSACANGIPAITMGEPGHCAYAVYVDGEWKPSNSISEKRSPHWSTWGQNTWSSFQMMTAMYQDGALTRDAQMVCTLASVLASHKNPVKALKLYELAVQMQPLNHPVWSRYIETASKSLKRHPRKWLAVNEFVCEAVTPGHPEMCARFLTEGIYPSMLGSLRSPKQKMAAFEAYYKNLNINEKSEWDMEALLNLQYESLGKSRVHKLEFIKLVVGSVAEHPTFGIGLTWAVKAAYAETKRVGSEVVSMVEKQMETSEDKDLLAAAVIRAAEELGDFDLANKWSEPYLGGAGKTMPEFEPIGGNLVSAGGLVHLSQYADDQSSIIHHAAALTEAGGHIKSESGKHQTVTVELPKATRIGGVVIVPTNGAQDYRVWKMDISTDGKSWKTLAELPDNKQDKVIRICIKHNNPSAKFIRIDSGENQGVGIDFKAILVYDNKKAK